jgi:hypothetical protein
LMPTGEISEDLKRIEAFYQTVTPKYSEKYNPKIGAL